jgi:hypothetical protein
MKNNIEIWKDIDGYEGIYQISNLGNVKSLFRYVKNKHNTLSLKKECILKLSNDKDGYKIISLLKNGVSKTCRVHFLVCQAYLTEKLSESYVIDHINNIKGDNRVSNLQYISFRENVSKDSNNKYNFLGVYKNGNKFSAKIVIDGVRKYLGTFNTPEEANNEYLKNLNLIKI